jgi:putative oxidoreductase
MMAKYGLPVPMLAYVVTVVIELLGGIALLLGFMTRPVAVVLGLWCIATALVAHANFGDPNMRAHFMKNVAMAGGFVYVWAFGAGSLSIDRWRHSATM